MPFHRRLAMINDSSRPSAAPTRLLDQQTWWQKPLIWGSFLLLVYLLREFFLIGFLTFLICFIVRSLVGVVTRRFGLDRQARGVDLSLTICIFLVILCTLYGLGRVFVPRVVRQGKSLVMQMKNLNAASVQNAILARTVGTWEFGRQFGAPEDPRYQKALAEFKAAGRTGEGMYATFPSLHSRLESEFEANYEQAQVLHLRAEGIQGADSVLPLQQWFLKIKAPELYQVKGDYYRSLWEAEYASPEKAGDLTRLQQQPDFEAQRDEQIRSRMWDDIKSDPVLFAQLRDEWSKTVAVQQWNQLRESPAYQAQFKAFYETQANDAPDTVPIDYAYYQKLAAAYPKGKQAFLDVVRQHHEQGGESPTHEQYDFESAKKLEFGQQWWASSNVADWVRDHAANEGPKVLETVVGWFDKRLGDLFRVPIQVVTALFLAVITLVEWDHLKSGVANLRNTRLQTIYDEVTPGIVALGKLIGKSFQGQMMIAMINACLTLVALWWIGVEYKFVLALVVFLFSFIPVVGVVLSGVPICAIAILQPGGSLWMVAQVVLAIAIIHLIESMILSPRILGKIGHLHPVVVIVILLVAEKFFGMWGLILGVPVAIYIIQVVILDAPIPGIYEPRRADGVVSLTSQSA